MVLGRVLEHTGGMLDKLEAIPRLSIFLDDDAFRAQIKHVGVAIMGESHSLAPADKRIYATRDITATVDSIPLITASILAKKLAEWLDALVMDVKVGSGALMLTSISSKRWRRPLWASQTARGAKHRDTDRYESGLGSSAGNALEVREVVRFLTNDERNSRLFEVTMALCSEMLIIVGLANGETEARAALLRALWTASAECFGRLASA